MGDITKEIHTSRLEINIAKLYLFFLPFRLFVQLAGLQSIVGVCANYMAFVFHVLGVMIWLINENGKISFAGLDNFSFINRAGILTIYLHLSSLVMAVAIQITMGNQGGESAFSGIAGMVIYFTQYFLIFVYNARVFDILDRETINYILHWVCLVLLFIGYFQVLVMNGVGGSVYDSLNIFGNLNSSGNLPKLCLTGAEGATAGCIIAIFVFPYLLSQALYTRKKIYMLEIILWLIPLFFTYSSTAYILTACDILMFALLLVRSSENIQSNLKMILFIVIVLIVGVLILLETGLFGDEAVEQIEYLLLEKVTDTSNGSTTSRTVPLLVNWGAFTEFPILGVGNGLQGYFYEKYFPTWALNVEGSDVGVFLERSRTGIANGGVFIPSLLSGYGIVGCLFIALFVYSLVRMNKRRKNVNGNFYSMFIIAAVAFFIAGFQGDMYGMYFAWFMLSLPLYDGTTEYNLKEDVAT